MNRNQYHKIAKGPNIWAKYIGVIVIRSVKSALLLCLRGLPCLLAVAATHATSGVPRMIMLKQEPKEV